MKIYEGYSLYNGKDGRLRAYDHKTGKVISCPRILMEKKLGRPLDPKMQVHHKDEDTTNNEDDNLALEPFKEHQRKHNPSKYTDMYVECDYCGKIFLWTAKKQRIFHSNASRKENKSKNRHHFCSHSCAGKYGRQEQLGRNV